MLKQIAWNTFKNTGDINTFMELKEVDKAIENAKDKDILEKDEILTNRNRKKEKWEL